MPSGLESLLKNPRRLQQWSETPGNYESALRYASQGQPQSRLARRPTSRTNSTKKEPGTLETGEYIEQVELPGGELVKPATESGKLVKIPGKSNLFVDPANGEPYNADPSQPTGLRSAWNNARQVKRDGKVFKTISGVGEREIGPDPKVAEDAAKAAAKREAENRRLAMAREKRPYNIDRVTGEPVPLQSDEDWAALKQAKAAKLDEAARVKRLKDQADLLELDAKDVRETAPKPAKEDEEAFTAAESALSQFAAGQDMDEAAAKYAAAPATDEASQQAKAAAENYLAYKDKVKPAKEAEKKAKELETRARDIQRQILDPKGWKAGKTASLAALPDDDLVAEVQAQADIINEQEEQAVGTLDFITKGRNKIVEEINAFQEERRLQSEQGLNAEELEALNLQQALLEQALADYDEHNSEAKAESDAALKAAADRRDVLAVADTELEGRAAKQAEAAGQAKAKAETMAKAKPLYEGWAKGLYAEDWRNEDSPRLEQEAKKAGLDVAQAKEALQTYRQLDWSNTRRDPQTAKPIAEESRTLPDGNVTVNPTMWGDATAYQKAVEASQGTPEGKAKALEAFPKLQEIHAEKAVEILSQSANIPGADNFMAWRERKIEEDQATQGKLGFARQSPAKQAIAYMDEMKNRSWFRKAGEQVAMGLLAGFQDIATQALGVGGMVTGSETLADLAAANAENTQNVVGAQSLEGSDTDYALRVMGMGARMTPAVAAMISGAGAVGGGLGTAAVLAGGQTAGSMFADLYRTAKEDAGLSHGEAWRKAALPAALAGVISGLITKGMGPTGLERIFSDKTMQETARNTFKGLLGQFVKGAAEELPDEVADEYFTTILQESAASADPVATLKNFANTLPELAGVTALMGGAGALMQARRQASGQEGMAPPPEGEAPAMPVQPRPAGPAPTPAPEAPTAQDPIEAAVVAGLVAPKRPNPIEAAAQAGLVAPVRPRPQEVEAAATAGLTAPSAISRAIANQIAKFNPTGATPLPQSVAATAKRTGRPPEAVARQAAAGVVKIAQGQSLESLDIEEQEALGFINKGGKITPDTKVTPLVYLYKDKPVLRNAAAEWLTDEAQEGLAGMVNLTEAERKAQIDAEEAAAKAKPAAKKKAGQAPAAKTESTPQVSGEAITGGSLPSNTGANPVPATISGATEAPKPSQTITGSNAEMAAEMPVPDKVTEPSPGEALKEFQQKLNTHWEKPSSKNEAWQLAADSPQGIWVEDGTGARARKIKRRTTQLGRDEIQFESQLWNEETQIWEDNPNGYSAITLRPDGTITGDLPEAWKPGSYTEATGKRIQTKPIVNTNEQGPPPPEQQAAPVEVRPEAPAGMEAVSTRPGPVLPSEPELPVVPAEPPAPPRQASAKPAPAASQPAGGLSPAQADQMARAQAAHEKSKATIQRMENDPEIRAKKLYAEGMRFAAIKRQITGKLTGKEQEAKAKREASNYEGKAVSVDGKNGEVVGNAFGKVKVKFTDGTKAAVPAAKVKPPVEAAPPPSRPQGGQTEEAGASNVAPGEGSISPATATSLPQEPAQASQKEASQPAPAAKPPEQMTPEEWAKANPINDPRDPSKGAQRSGGILEQEFPRSRGGVKWKEKGISFGFQEHAREVQLALNKGKPVSARAVSAYLQPKFNGIILPAGYIQEGDLYVYRPEASPAPASQEAGQAEAKGDLAKAISRGAVIVSEDDKFVITEKKGIRDNNIYFAYAKDSGDELVGGQPFESLAKARAFMGMEPSKAAQPPRPATPEGRAEAALAEYEAEVRKTLVGKPDKAAKDLAGRKLDLAKRLRARLKAMTGAVDYDVYKPELREASGELEVDKVGILFINPEKLIDRLAKDFPNMEKARGEMDAWMLHEFIHMGALSKMSANKIVGLYEALTPDAKEASRKLYFGGKDTQFPTDSQGRPFNAAHEWFAQQVEAILRGEIANSGDIKGISDPTLRENLVALLRDFVAQLRDIAATLQGKNAKLAAEIRAQAEAVGKIASDMAAKAGLELGRAEGGQATEAKPADVIRQHLDADDAASALAVFNGMTKEEINKTAQAVFGRGFYNNTKTEMLAALSQWLPDSTKSVMQNLAKQSAIASAKRALKTAKENQSRHAEGILGMPATDQAFKSVSEAEGKDPHGIGKESVAKAWQKEVDDAQAKLDALEGTPAPAPPAAPAEAKAEPGQEAGQAQAVPTPEAEAQPEAETQPEAQKGTEVQYRELGTSNGEANTTVFFKAPGFQGETNMRTKSRLSKEIMLTRYEYDPKSKYGSRKTVNVHGFGPYVSVKDAKAVLEKAWEAGRLKFNDVGQLVKIEPGVSDAIDIKNLPAPAGGWRGRITGNTADFISDGTMLFLRSKIRSLAIVNKPSSIWDENSAATKDQQTPTLWKNVTVENADKLRDMKPVGSALTDDGLRRAYFRTEQGNTITLDAAKLGVFMKTVGKVDKWAVTFENSRPGPVVAYRSGEPVGVIMPLSGLEADRAMAALVEQALSQGQPAQAPRPAPPVTAEPSPAPAKPRPMNMAGQVRPEKKKAEKFTLPPQEPFKPSAERFAQFYRDYGIPEDVAMKNGANLMDAIETGEWTNLLHPDNKRSRAIWEAWTRQKLPAGVKASEEEFSKFITEYHATSNPVTDLTDEELGRELLRIGPLALKPSASEATKARALALAKENATRQPSPAKQTREEAAEAARAIAGQDPSIPPPPPDDVETLQALRDRANRKGYKPDRLTPARLAVGIRAGWVTKTKEAKLTEKGYSQLAEWEQQQSSHDRALGALSDKLVDEAVSKWDRENDPTSWEAMNTARQPSPAAQAPAEAPEAGQPAQAPAEGGKVQAGLGLPPSPDKVNAAVEAVKNANSTGQAEPILNGLSVEELKQVAKATNYPPTGSKKDLIRRLLNAVSFRAGARAIMGDAKVPNAILAERTPEQQSEFQESLRQERNAADAAQATAPKQAKPDRSQDSFNRSMEAIRSQALALPPGQPAVTAGQDAEPEAEPAQTDADMEAFIAEQQAIAEEEAAAREALRNDPDAIDAVQASGKMSGRNLSKQFEYPEARAVYQALTAARDMLGGPETVQLDKLREWAKKTFESDPKKYVQWAADMAEDNKLLDVDEQAVLGQAFQFLTREARLTGDKNIRALLNKVGNYYLNIGTRLSQALGARRDPLETPQERWTKALDIVFGPSEAVRRKLRILPTEAGKARRIASLEAELAEARGSRRADVEAALKTARAQETKEELLEKDDAESQKIKERVLKNIGVTEDDLMLSGTDRVAMHSAILDLPAVKAGLEAYKGKDNDGYNIMRLAFRGFSDAHIANALNLNQDDVGQFIHDATNAIIRPAVAEQVKAGTGFGGLIKAGFARLKKAVGLGLPPKAIEDQPSLIKGTRQTVDDVTAEVNRVMKYALQSAKARNSGKLMSKVVMTPSGQRVRVFVPFDPDDMANYYAFAREYTAAKASAFDKVYEYWINWPLLSGPQTQVANITGNAAQVAWHYTGQRLAEATLNLAYQDPNAPQFREFKHILKGFWQGIGPAFEMARQTFLTEGDTIRHKYLGQPLEIDVVDGDLDKVGNIRASVGGQAGRISRLPGRVLRFTDAFFKTAIMYAEASAVAYRRAHVEAKRQGLKGQARAAFIDTEITNTLNDTSSGVWGEVMKTAEELLFQDENMATEIVDTAIGGYKGIRDLEKLLAEAEAKGDSELAAKLQKRIRSRKFVGSLKRWIFPFQRTPTNIVRAGIKKAGGSAISLFYGLTRAGWLAIGKDGVPMIKSYPKAMQIKDASETLLAGLGWLALASMLEGDDDDDKKKYLLVGTRSHSLKERAATDQFLRKYGGENSLVRQDGDGKVLWSVPFGRYEPAATLLTTWIDAYRNYQEVKRLKSQGENASYLTYMLSSLVSSLEDKSFLQGFANAMQFIRDVEEKRENPDENAGVKMLMNNVIPNLIKQPLRNMDDVLRERTTAGPGYAALPNPTIAPKLPVFAAQPKISTTGERLPKAFTPPARLLFQANTKVTPQPDALLYRANRLHPTKRWSPQPLNRDDYTADPPGKAKPVPITDPAKKRQFAELAGRLYATKAAQVAAKAMPSERQAPGESLIKAFRQAREDAMAAARKQAHAMGLHKATATP